MKLKSLLLGSAAALALSTGAQAADAVISVVSLNACDAFGISGLTISTDDTCLSVSGEVSYDFTWGDYANFNPQIPTVVTSGGIYNNLREDGNTDWDSRVQWELTFEATSESDMGPAVAVLKLEGDDRYRWENGVDRNTGDDGVEFSEAYVSIGDTTVLTAGLAPSIANFGDDRAYNHLGTFLEQAHGGVDALTEPHDGSNGGHAIQIESEFGNGLSAGIALEQLDDTGAGAGLLVGVIEASQSWGSAHLTAIVDDVLDGFDSSNFYIHTGATVNFDPVSVRGAVAYDGLNDYWAGLLSAEATFDMFTVAATVEGTNYDEFGFGASVGANITETVEVNVGFRYFNEGSGFTRTSSGEVFAPVPDLETWQVEAEVVAAVAENLEASVNLGLINGGTIPGGEDQLIYGGVGLEYAPGGNLTIDGGAEVNSIGAYQLSFGASKSF